MSLAQWVPQCRWIYDKFHVMQHANEAVTEVRRAEFFRKGGAARESIKGKHWLLLTRWVHLNTNKKRQLNKLNLEGILNYCKIKVPLGLWKPCRETSKRCCAVVGATAISITCS